MVTEPSLSSQSEIGSHLVNVHLPPLILSQFKFIFQAKNYFKMQLVSKFFLSLLLIALTRKSLSHPTGEKKVETTTVKILIPPPSFDETDDDAVIIDADSDSSTLRPPVPDNFTLKDCLLPEEKGPCKAIIPQFFFNAESSKCEEFSWSGCGGNLNRFTEKTHCETFCEKRISQLGSVSGNPDDANQQSHLTEAEIARQAEKPEDVCLLPETRGNCRAMMTRWRYNAEIKECVQFHYGGCDGNPNNFVSQEKCTEFCRGQ